MDGIEFEKVTAQQNALLIERFSLDEIEDILGQSDGDKSPGPDGFNYPSLNLVGIF